MSPWSRFIALALLALSACAGGRPTDAPPPLSQTEQSRAAITGFARMMRDEHRPFDAFHRYFAPDLIQHDPWIADGNGGDTAFLEKRRAEQPDKYDATDQYASVIHNIMADGDLVAIKSHVFTSPADPGRVFVDIWRVRGGRFVEHWDVIQPIDHEPVNGGQVGCGKGITYAQAKALTGLVDNPACGAPDRSADGEASKRLVMAYLAMGQQPGRLEEAINTFLSDDFVQHSAHIPPGRQGLLDYMRPRAAARAAAHRTSHIARVLADGDLVLVHRRVTTDSDPRGIAYADLFRVRGGKVTDHWDVIQPIPAFSVSGRSLVDGPLEPGRYHGPPPPGQNE